MIPPKLPKRMPSSKSGRILVALANRLILIAANDFVTNGSASEKDIVAISKLTKRIQYRLDRETEKLFQQCSLFSSFEVTFIKPRKNGVKHTKTVNASSRRMAIKMIKQRYGKQTKIIR